nr:hypothetical protein [Gaetbulibacter sp. 4G1]
MYNERLEKNVIENLYSDKFFVPVFGVKFDELSDKQIRYIWKKSSKCLTKKSFIAQSPWRSKRFLYPFAIDFTVFKYRHTDIKKSVVEYRILQKKYNDLENSILNGEMSLTELQNLQSRIPREFNKLFPSEITELKRVIEDNKSLSASNELFKNLSFVRFENISYFLKYLLDFKREHKNQYNALDIASKEKIDNKLSDLLKEVSKSYQSEELILIQSIENSMNGLEKITRQYREFNNLFSYYSNKIEISEINRAYRQKKTLLVGLLSSELNKRISSTNKLSEIELINSQYLVGLEKDDLTINNLVQLLDEKRIELKKIEAEKRRLIAEDRRLKAEKEKTRLEKIAKEKAERVKAEKLKREKSEALSDSEIMEISKAKNVLFKDYMKAGAHTKFFQAIYDGEFDEAKNHFKIHEEYFATLYTYFSIILSQGNIEFYSKYSEYEKIFLLSDTKTKNIWTKPRYSNTIRHYSRFAILNYSNVFEGIQMIKEWESYVSDMRNFVKNFEPDSGVINRITENLYRYANGLTPKD